ncbi:MAG TPA: hypothetical protein VFC51_00975 [Chloroflexota bacterium]|nr:hypothetical protein [Chloroflexota bacterium]
MNVDRVLRPWVALPPAVRLALLGAATAATYTLGFALPYPISVGLARPLQQFARITGPSLGPTLGLVVTLLVLFALYLAAIATARQCADRRGMAIVLGAGALSTLALLVTYPLFSLDIFYYMSADRIWSVYHENPFVVPPLQAAHDPFFPYTAWGHYPLPYGPLWPWLTRFTGSAGGGDIGRTLLAFKALSSAAYLLAIPAVAWAAAPLGPGRRVVASCAFAWNPLVLIELVGNGHNDAVALLPTVLAVGFWLRGPSAPTVWALCVSFLVKATVAVAVPAFLVAGIRDALTRGRFRRWMLTSAAPVLGLTVLAWLPFRNGPTTGFLRETQQYFHSPTAVVAALLTARAPEWRASAVELTQILLLVCFAGYYFSQLRTLSQEGPRALGAVWRIFVLYFVVVSPFFSPWYVVWPVATAAILGNARTRAFSTALSFGAMCTYLVQFVLRPVSGGLPGTAALGAMSIAVATAPMLAYWAATTQTARRVTGAASWPAKRVAVAQMERRPRSEGGSVVRSRAQ